MLTRRNVVVLSVIPVALFCLATVLRDARGPYHLGANSDPDYAYLFNSLNILGLQAPDMVEHPGTTVQMLGAVAIVARWLPALLVGGASNVQDAVLSDPEAYLSAISTLFAILVGVSTFIAGVAAYRGWGKLLPALIIQLTLLLFTPLVTALPKVSPEPLLIAATLILIATLIPLTTASPSALESRYAFPLLIGTLVGFGVATKFTFLPFLGFVFLLQGWTRRAMALGASVIAFVVFTAPIAVHYSSVVLWLRTLATHKGVNGSGEVGVPDISTMFANLDFLVAAAAPLFVLLGFYAACALVIAFKSLASAPPEMIQVRTLVIMSCVVILLQIAATVKNVGAHYLIPSMVLAGLPSATIVSLVLHRIPRGRPPLITATAGVAALLVGVWSAGADAYGHAKNVSADVAGTAVLETQVRQKSATVVGYYGSSLETYALAFGNDFAKDRYNARLQALYPTAAFYSIWLEQFYSFAGQLTDEEITRRLNEGDTIVLFGFPLVDSYAAYSKGLLIEPLFIGPREAAYRLVRIAR